MSDHSLLAPSDAERWSRCAGAPHLSRGLPEVDAEYNASGTCSHWILERCLKNNTAADIWLNTEMSFGINPATGQPFKFVIDEDRVDRIQQVVNQILSEPGQMWTEKRLNTSPVLGVPDQQGHADIVKLDTRGAVEIDGVPHVGVLSVHDFKDGYITVYAKNNLQGLNYLAAALYEFDLVAPISALRFVIHQPKVSHYDEWTYSRVEIEHFVSLIRPMAKLVYDIYHGNVEFDPDKHLNPGDEQCFWCPVRGRCPARQKWFIEMCKPLIDKYEVNDESLGALYAKLEAIEQAAKDYRAEALRRVLMGRQIAGQKLVQGKQGPRKYTDQAAQKKAEAALQAALPLEKMLELYEPRTILSPTQAEKRLTDDQYATLIKPYVTRAPGSYSLAPLADKRPAVTVPQFGIVKEPTNVDPLA